MITQAEKKELVDWLSELEDPELVRTIKSIKESSESPISWDDLPEAAKASIKRGLEDSKAGRVYTHEEVRKIYKKWL